jgi:hypothetical protein
MKICMIHRLVPLLGDAGIFFSISLKEKFPSDAIGGLPGCQLAQMPSPRWIAGQNR